MRIGPFGQALAGKSALRCWATILSWLWAVGTHAAVLPPLAPVPTNQPFTFAVLGDNRGGSGGELSEAFPGLLEAVREAKPAFVLNTGDMIYGNTDEASAREQWRQYKEAIAPLGVPTFHAPGNHDIWNEASGRLYRELWGPTYFSMDYGSARIIGLDTETQESRLGNAQMHWLEQQLADPGPPMVFIFLHRPLFPADGGIGSSLDVHSAERDQLHQLFLRHRKQIKAVFVGHEHLYHFEERDGVRYYTTGGGGADLYQAGELGGFHHFLLVSVEGSEATVALKKVGPSRQGLREPKRVQPGALLESWEEGLIWQPWNYTVTTEITPNHASQGQSGLQLNFDLAQCGWPTLVLPLDPAWDLRSLQALKIDIFVPNELKQSLTVTPALEVKAKREFPILKLKPGWNTVRSELEKLLKEFRSDAHAIEWTITANDHRLRGAVVFDNFRLERTEPGGAVSSQLQESWERLLLWRVADESVSAATTLGTATDGKRALKVQFDFSKCAQPVLLARLNPPWDLQEVNSLSVDVFVGAASGNVITLNLALRAEEAEHAAEPVLLHRGWNQVQQRLDTSWLPRNAWAKAEQIEWRLSSTNKSLRGWVLFDRLRAEKL